MEREGASDECGVRSGHSRVMLIWTREPRRSLLQTIAEIIVGAIILAIIALAVYRIEG